MFSPTHFPSFFSSTSRKLYVHLGPIPIDLEKYFSSDSVSSHPSEALRCDLQLTISSRSLVSFVVVFSQFLKIATLTVGHG